MTAATTDMTLKVVNDAMSQPQPIVYVDTEASLDVTLDNQGGAITLTSGGDSASNLEIYLPDYFTPADVKAMGIQLADWKFSINASDPSLVLTYTGTTGKTWTGPITFKITNAKSSASPTTGSLQVNFNNMSGDVPSQLTTSLTLLKAPQPGNASLLDMLQVSLDSQGSVYVSDPKDPLQNTLFLNFKNTGVNDLFSGTGSAGSPTVTVTFIYGNTSGALAPDNDRDQKPSGSAWNIEATITIDQTDGWTYSPAKSTDPHPVWTFSPTNTNKGVIQTRAKSNVTFEFSNIISFTPPGHTQMVVAFSGFKKDDQTDYDDYVFVLDINKQNPPPTRGLLNFFGTDSPTINVANSSTPITIPFRWAMFDVATVHLITSFLGMETYTKTYAAPPKPPLPLAYDNHSITIPSITESKPVFTTLQAMGGNGAFLNSMQFTVFLRLMVFVDPRDNQEYPIRLFNNKLWMTKNLNYPDKDSVIYNNYADNAQKYGRLYPANVSSAMSPPGGWRLPSVADWQGLFDSIGDKNHAYNKLTQQGPEDFAAQFGGQYNPNPSPQFSGVPDYGYFRTAGSNIYAGFSAVSKSVSVVATIADDVAISIRYVKDL